MHEVQTWSYSDLAGTLPRVMAGVRALASASVWAVVARCLLLTRSTPGGIAVENSHAVASMTLQRFTTVVRGPLVFPPWLIGPESGLRRGNLHQTWRSSLTHLFPLVVIGFLPRPRAGARGSGSRFFVQPPLHPGSSLAKFPSS